MPKIIEQVKEGVAYALNQLGIGTPAGGPGQGQNSVSIDAAGRQRVSEQRTWLESKNLDGIDPDILSGATVGTGAAVASNGFIDMTVSANLDQSRQATFARAPYFSGKSILIEVTCKNFGVQADVTKRMGYFSINPFLQADGIWLEAGGGTHKIQIANRGAGESTTIARANWNDSLDGNGASGYTHDFNQFTVILIDFLYLGGTGARFYIKNGANWIHFHTYNHAGAYNYMIVGSPQQPIMFDMVSAGGAGVFGMGCFQVSEEGASSDVLKSIPISNDTTDIRMTSADTRYALLGMRLNDEFACAWPSAVSLLALSNSPFRWELVRNPTIAGTAPTWSQINGNPVDMAVGISDNVVTGGETLKNGYGQQRSSQDIAIGTLAQRPGYSAAGIADEFWIVASSPSASVDMLSSMDIDYVQ